VSNDNALGYEPGVGNGIECLPRDESTRAVATSDRGAAEKGTADWPMETVRSWGTKICYPAGDGWESRSPGQTHCNVRRGKGCGRSQVRWLGVPETLARRVEEENNLSDSLGADRLGSLNPGKQVTMWYGVRNLRRNMYEEILSRPNRRRPRMTWPGSVPLDHSPDGHF